VEELNTQLELKIKELETANRAITSLSREVKAKNRDLETAVERLKKMNDIGRVLTSIIETEEIVKIITRTTADLFNTDKALLHIRNTGKPPLIIQYCRGLGSEILDELPHEYEAQYSDIVLQGKPVTLNQNLSSLLDGLPLGGRAVVRAIIWIHGPKAQVLTRISILTTFSNQAIVAIENVAVQKA
jgi:hypothetical protein